MSTSLARRFRVDVSTDNSAWTQLKGITDFNPQDTANKADSTTYDDDGYTASEIPTRSWSAVIKCLRQTDSGGSYDAGQELARACDGEFGDDARLYIRWYDKVEGTEAKSGQAIVEWNESKTGVADLNEVQITFTGDGALTKLDDLTPSSTAVPTILSALDSAVAAGGQVEITGTGFLDVVASTGVKFGSTSATSWKVVSSRVLVAIMPAGSAGAANIVVTNSVGASNAFSYTRGA